MAGGDGTSRDRNTYIRRFDAAIAILIAALYALTSIAIPPFAGWPFGFLHPVNGIVLPFAIVFGLPAVAGAFIGVILRNVVSDVSAVETLFVAIAHSYLAFSAAQLRGRSSLLVANRIPLESPLSLYRDYLTLCVIGCGGAAAIIAWGYEVVGVSPFFQISLISFVGLTIMSGIIGFSIFVVLRGITSRSRRIPINHSSEFRGRIKAVRAITALWLALGYFGSVGYRMLENLGPRALPQSIQFLKLLDQPNLFGPGAGLVQSLFGAIMFSLLAFAYRRRKAFGDR